ncbi:MAG: KEOPS complex kinase/ATPase Bud32 [Candidatus Woesearchaeota archaeon]
MKIVNKKIKKDKERVLKKFDKKELNLISSGAEALIYESNKEILKYRIKKNYRIDKIDSKLRKFRTKREFKVMKKLNDKINVPKVIKRTDFMILMEKIEGQKLSNLKKIDNTHLKEVGKSLANIHNNKIMHGDLTTSNIILSNGKIYFIDFGLSKFSRKVEDYAVDIHLLNRALESKHFQNFPKNYEIIIESYKKEANKAKETLNRLKIVETRGRYKQK